MSGSDTPSANAEPLAAPLGRAAAELADLARLGDRLECLITDLVALMGETSSALIAECQIADLLSQRLAGLAMFLVSLAAAAPADAVVDVQDSVRGLTLADQAARLSGRKAAPARFDLEGELALLED